MLLKERHDGHFMVWNLAEEAYDYSLFDGQVRGSACARVCVCSARVRLAAGVCVVLCLPTPARLHLAASAAAVRGAPCAPTAPPLPPLLPSR